MTGNYLRWHEMRVGRRYDLDNLKVALVALVIAHHLAISFGASGSWYFVDARAPRSLGLSILNTINQSFFMGLFFFISGYFTPASLHRKGVGRFVIERTRRLLVPIVFFGLLAAPWLEYVKRTSLSRPTPPFSTYYFERIAEWREFDPGPLWFGWALWLVSLPYALLCVLRPPTPPREPIRVGDGQIFALAAVIGVASFGVRIVAPIGFNFLHIQLAYVPQYALMFAAGIIAARHGLLTQIERQRFASWLVAVAAGVAAGSFVFVVAAHGDGKLLQGGAGWPALGWALSESSCGTAISACLIIGFRGWVAGQSRLSRALAANAYAAFVVHAPLVVGVALVVGRLALPSFAAWVVSVLVAIPICFSVALLLCRVPGVAQVL